MFHRPNCSRIVHHKASCCSPSPLSRQSRYRFSTISPAAAPDEAQAIAEALANHAYVPSHLEGPGLEAWAGFVAGVVPFLIGASEFGKRILIQQRCKTCSGSGLVPVMSGPLIDMETAGIEAGAGAGKMRPRRMKKCLECGGFFPWVSWEMFLTSNASPGNGGPLLQPRGQKSVFYSVPEAKDTPSSTRDHQP